MIVSVQKSIQIKTENVCKKIQRCSALFLYINTKLAFDQHNSTLKNTDYVFLWKSQKVLILKTTYASQTEELRELN